MVSPHILHKSVKYDLYLLVLGDVLMLIMSTVLSEKCIALNIVLELFLLLLTKGLKHAKELLPDELSPVESFLMIIFL
jgi:hypothetical protein